MRRGRIFFYLAFIVLLGSLAFYLIWQRYLRPGAITPTAGPAPTPVVSTVNVIVTTQKVPRGGTFTADVLGMVPIQQELFYDGMFSNIGEVEGRLAKFDLEAGIPLTRGMIADTAEQLSEAGSTAALSIPRGMVAISIPISRLSSVSYAIQPGDHVNILATMLFVDLDQDFQTALPNQNTNVLTPGSAVSSVTSSANQSQTSGQDQVDQAQADASASVSTQITNESIVAVSGAGGGVVGRSVEDPVLGQTFYHVPSESRQRPRLVSQSLLQDVVVLHVGNFPYSGQMLAAEAAPQTAAGPAQPVETPQEQAAVETQPPDVITLIVTPQDAISLNYLMYSGSQLNLVLRAVGDDTRVETESVTLQFLLQQYEISVPAKLPTGLEPAVQSLQAPVLQNDAVATPAP